MRGVGETQFRFAKGSSGLVSSTFFNPLPFILHFTFILFTSLLFNLNPEAFAKKVSLSEIEKIALERSPEIRAKASDFEALRNQAEASGLLPNPEVIGQFGRTESGNSWGTSLDLSIYQTLPFPGKRAKLERAGLKLSEIGKLSEEEAKLNVQHAALLSSVHLASVIEISKHTSERKRRLGLINQYLSHQALASPSQQVEAALIENEVLLLEKSIFLLESELKSARSLLNFLVGSPDNAGELDDQEQIEPEVQWLTRTNPIDSGEKLSQAAPETSFGILKQKAEVERSVLLRERASLEWLPDFKIQMGYRKENVSPPNLFHWGGVGLTLPLFDHGQYSRPAAQARLEAERARLEKSEREEQARLRNARAELESAMKILAKFPLTLVKKSEDRFDMAEKEFRRGRIGATALLQLDSQIHETLDSIYRSQKEYLEKKSAFLLLRRKKLEWN